jgi:hypothetical protein
MRLGVRWLAGMLRDRLRGFYICKKVSEHATMRSYDTGVLGIFMTV